MCTSINHQHDRRQRWWTGNMRLDKQNNEFQQPEPAMHTLWLLFKHVLIMSPCLQLCKHILHTLRLELGRIPVLENGRHQFCKRKTSSHFAGREVTKRWVGCHELLKPSLHGRGKKGIKSLLTEGQKTDYSLLVGVGAQRSGFSCVLYFTISLQVKRRRKFYSSLTVQRELHPSPDAGIRPPLPSRLWGEVVVGSVLPFAGIQLPDVLKKAQITDTDAARESCRDV